jgi:FAD/FMN-containing dehydrogenase
MSTTETDRPQAVYALGHTPEEYERLRMQARVWEATTGRLLDQVGLGPGASCLDAGCGPGETMRAMAERAGPTGRVLGIDADASLGGLALAMLHGAGHRQCAFSTQDLNSGGPIPGAPFDLVYARLLLFHLPQRVRDNLISAEVVLADGRVVRASEKEHADLFWGIRGGGGNFGIITQFEFRLHPLGPTVLAGLTMFPIDRAPDVLPRWREWSDAVPDEVATACAVVTAPPEPFVPLELHGKPVLGVILLYVGDPAAGAGAAQAIKDLGPAVDLIGPMPYTAFQASLDGFAPYGGARFYARGEYLPALSDGAIAEFLAHAPDLAARSHPVSQMIIFRIGQGVAAVPDEATAFSHRGASYLFHPITAWADPADDTRMIAATREFAAAMRPFSTGASYLNFTHEPDRVRDAYGDGKYARLVALKDTYDPANLFRLNQNIKPSRPAAEPALA